MDRDGTEPRLSRACLRLLSRAPAVCSPFDPRRVYSYIVGRLRNGGAPLRLMVQALSPPRRPPIRCCLRVGMSSAPPNETKRGVGWHRQLGEQDAGMWGDSAPYLDCLAVLVGRGSSDALERAPWGEPQKTFRGKSFLLTSIFLFCIVNRRKCKACAPTGEGTGKTPPFTQALCRPPWLP